jgi:hypothetical protein
MDYTTKSGYVLTEEMIEALGQACERGEYPGSPGEFIVSPVGRPQLCPSEDLVTVAFKVPRTQREALDAKAAQDHKTRSQFMREVLSEALIS